MALEEAGVLRISERGRVTLARDGETGKRYARKELQGRYPVYAQRDGIPKSSCIFNYKCYT